MSRAVAFAVAAALAPLTAAACAQNQPHLDTGVLNVVAGENFWGSVAAQIGGSHVRVTSIVSDPNADPHLYESSAASAAAVGAAELVIENGAGYDDFLTKLLGATSGGNRAVIDIQAVLGKTGSDVNPHFWYDVPHVPRIASAIETALARIEPANTPSFQANLAAFDASLQPIAAVISQIRERHLHAPVAYTERVPEYLLIAAGLDVKTPAGFARAIEDGNDPGPGDTAAMDRLISSRGIDALLYNAQAVSAITQSAQKLAQEARIPIVPVTETLPPAYATYQAWQLGQTQALLRALGG